MSSWCETYLKLIYMKWYYAVKYYWPFRYHAPATFSPPLIPLLQHNYHIFVKKVLTCLVVLSILCHGHFLTCSFLTSPLISDNDIIGFAKNDNSKVKYSRSISPLINTCSVTSLTYIIYFFMLSFTIWFGSFITFQILYNMWKYRFI